MRWPVGVGVAMAALGAFGALWTARSRSFRGRVVLITGGSRGLGLAVAKRLADEGAKLALLARDPEELARACAEVRALGAECIALSADVADRVAVEDSVARVVARFGALDAVVNCAGVIQLAPVEHTVEADYREALDTSFWGPLHVVRAAFPHLRKSSRPRILNVASIAGRVAHPHLVPYSVGKAALDAFSDGLRSELASQGIAVTTVDPGPLDTGGHLHTEVRDSPQAKALFDALEVGPLAVSDERAARKIVEAMRAGTPVLTIGLPAKIAKVLDALMPRTMARFHMLLA